ncbi:MAG TPA: hypothetical protein VGF69_09605 [Thermoanaerobaculia bacterium]|jgi:hypothetical protein
MSANNKAVSPVEPNPVVTNYRDEAQVRLQQLREIREAVPHFTIPETRDARRRMSVVAAVPPEFIELATVAVANQKGLARVDGASPAEVYDWMNYADAFSPLADELEALAQFVRYSVTVARNKAGSESLTTYSVAQRLAKRPENGHLVPHVDDMRRALGRARKPSPEKAEPPAKPAGNATPGSEK